jgi:hypothetical protein
LRSIEDVEATLAELQANNILLAITVLLRRQEFGSSATALADPTLAAMMVKPRRHLTTGIACATLCQLPD